MKLKLKLVLAAALLLAAPGIASAQSAIGSYARYRETLPADIPVPPAGYQATYISPVDHLLYRKNSAGATAVIGGGGGGGGTFATIYSVTPNDNRVQVNSTGGPLLMKPGSASQGDLLRAESSAGDLFLRISDNDDQYLVAPAGKSVYLWPNASGAGVTLGVSSSSVAVTNGPITQAEAAIGTAQTAGLTLANTTAAAVGAQQYSPMVTLSGRGWQTTGPASEALDWSIQGQPIQTTTHPDGDLVFMRAQNGGAPTRMLKMGTVNTTGGTVGVISGGVANGSGIAFDSGFSYFYNNASNGQNPIVMIGSLGAAIIRPFADTGAQLGAGNVRFLSLDIGNDTVGTGQVAGVTLSNTAAATVGAQKYSPMIELDGSGWQTTAGASATTKIAVQMRPVQGAASAVGGVLLMQSNGNNGTAGAYQKFGSLYSVYDTSQTTGGVTLAGWRLAIGAEAPGPSITLKNNEIYFGLSTSGNDTDTPWFYTTNGGLFCFTDEALYLGSPGHRWGGVHAQYHDTDQGAQLTAAATITPTKGQHHVTGATTIDTIAVTNFAGSSNPVFYMLADAGTITWSAAGNIKVAGTVAINKLQTFVYDSASSKWYPQQ